MIYLEKNSTNVVILELTSVSTIINPYYVFEFINDINSNKEYIIGDDVSGYKGRYNRFDITENDDPIEGQVSLKSGSYRYNIYENITNSIDVSNNNVISTGKLIVSGKDINIDSVYR